MSTKSKGTAKKKVNEIVQGAVLEAIKTGVIYNPHTKNYIDVNSQEGQHVKELLTACYTCKKPDYIYNVITGKCVRKKSKIGKKLQEYIDFCDDYAKEIVKYRPDDKKILDAIKNIQLPKTGNGWYATQHKIGDIIDGVKAVKPTDTYFKNAFFNEIAIAILALVSIVSTNPEFSGFIKDKVLSIFRHLNPSTVVTMIKTMAIEMDTGIIGKVLGRLKLKELWAFIVNAMTGFIAVFRGRKPTNKEAADNINSNFKIFNFVSNRKGPIREVQIEKNDLITLNKLKSMQAVTTKGNVHSVNLAKLRIADDKVKNAKSVSIVYDNINDVYNVKISNVIKAETVGQEGKTGESSKGIMTDRVLTVNLRRSVKQRQLDLQNQLREVKNNVTKLIVESNLEVEDNKIENDINGLLAAKSELEQRLNEEEYTELIDTNSRKINKSIDILKSKIKKIDLRIKTLRSSKKSKTTWHFTREQLNELQILKERISIQQKNISSITQDDIDFNYDLMTTEFGSIRGSLNKLLKIETFEFSNETKAPPKGWKANLETIVEVSTAKESAKTTVKSSVQQSANATSTKIFRFSPSTSPRTSPPKTTAVKFKLPSSAVSSMKTTSPKTSPKRKFSA